jgi:hypothetical protein
MAGWSAGDVYDLAVSVTCRPALLWAAPMRAVEADKAFAALGMQGQ